MPATPMETNAKVAPKWLDLVGQLNATMHLTAKDDDLLAKDRVLSFQPALRPERQGTCSQYHPNQRKHHL